MDRVGIEERAVSFAHAVAMGLRLKSDSWKQYLATFDRYLESELVLRFGK